MGQAPKLGISAAGEHGGPGEPGECGELSEPSEPGGSYHQAQRVILLMFSILLSFCIFWVKVVNVQGKRMHIW